MADIELVIKIPEIEYEHITNKEKFYSLEKSKKEWLINKILNYIMDGTPLPKGHGNLKDNSIIEELEQEPCDKCVYSTKDGCCQYDDIAETIPPLELWGNAIIREKLIKDLDFLYNKDGFIKDTRAKRTIEVIMEQAPVNPQESKTRHWVVDRKTFRMNLRGKQTFDYSVHCDKCNYHCDYTTDVEGSLPSKFCPNCGAKMEQEE